MAITTLEQYNALVAKGWTLDERNSGHRYESWHDGGAEIRLYDDGDVYVRTYINRQRLAEFLSIINAKDETVVVEGEVYVGYEVVVVGDSTTHDMLDKFDGRHVKVTIEPKDGENA